MEQQQEAREQSASASSDVQIVESDPSPSSSPSKAVNKKGPKKPFHKDQRQKPTYKVRDSPDEQPDPAPKAPQPVSWADSPVPMKPRPTKTASPASPSSSSPAPSSPSSSSPSSSSAPRKKPRLEDLRDKYENSIVELEEKGFKGQHLAGLIVKFDGRVADILAHVEAKKKAKHDQKQAHPRATDKTNAQESDSTPAFSVGGSKSFTPSCLTFPPDQPAAASSSSSSSSPSSSSSSQSKPYPKSGKHNSKGSNDSKPSHKGQRDPKAPAAVTAVAWDADDDSHAMEATLLNELKMLRVDFNQLDQRIRQCEEKINEIRAARRK